MQNSLLLDLGMDEDDEDPVPLPNVNAAILKKVRNQGLRKSASKAACCQENFLSSQKIFEGQKKLGE